MQDRTIELGKLGFYCDSNYLGLYCLPEYRSPQKTIWVYIRQTEEEKRLISNNVCLAELPVGGKYLDIHFIPQDLPKTKNPKDIANVRHIITVGLPEYLHFLESLKTDEILRDIEIVIGTTGETMAEFAIKYLGFLQIDFFERDDDLLKGAKDLKNGVEKPPINIYAPRQSLLGRKEKLLQIWQGLQRK